MTAIKEALLKYLEASQSKEIELKTILFDMDGVLYNSMPGHAYAWHKTMTEFGIKSTPEEFYLYEGQTGKRTIQYLFQREKGRSSTPEEDQKVYAKKTFYFNEYGTAPVMDGASEVLAKTMQAGLTPILVTGSGQASLLEKLQNNFPDTFPREHMVTAFDVTWGKPHPEPYLKGLEKTKSLASQAIVIENAPLGVRAAKAAGIFTIAVNTGPLDPQDLAQEGADIVLESMEQLATIFDQLITLIQETTYIR